MTVCFYKIERKKVCFCVNVCAIVSKHTQTSEHKNRNENISPVFLFLFSTCVQFSVNPFFLQRERESTHTQMYHWPTAQRVRDWNTPKVRSERDTTNREEMTYKTECNNSENKQFKKEFSVEIISNDIYRCVALDVLLLVLCLCYCWGSALFLVLWILKKAIIYWTCPKERGKRNKGTREGNKYKRKSISITNAKRIHTYIHTCERERYCMLYGQSWERKNYEMYDMERPTRWKCSIVLFLTRTHILCASTAIKIFKCRLEIYWMLQR